MGSDAASIDPTALKIEQTDLQGGAGHVKRSEAVSELQTRQEPIQSDIDIDNVSELFSEDADIDLQQQIPSLIHISEPTRLRRSSYAASCL